MLLLETVRMRCTLLRRDALLSCVLLLLGVEVETISPRQSLFHWPCRQLPELLKLTA